MSTTGSGWEGVKGFFRRQTQLIGEKYRDVPKTTDAAVEQSTGVVFEYQTRIKSFHTHMNGFVAAISQALGQLDAMKDDMNALYACNVEGLDLAAKNVEMAVRDMRAKLDTMQQAFSTDAETRNQYDRDCDKLRVMLEDRKAKMLEFDFFRNKVAGLRAKPPSDAARIPRNEGRLQEWGQLYEDANQKTKLMSQTLIGTGARLSAACTSTVLTEAGKFFDNAGRTCRAAFLGQTLPQAAAVAMATAQAMQTAQATVAEAPAAARQNAQQQGVQQAAAATQRQVQSPQSTANDSFGGRDPRPAQAGSSNRFVERDDPFKV